MNDLRLALRTLIKTPVVSGVAVFSLALGIGANTAMFSLFDQVLVRKLPLAAEPDRLVNFRDAGPRSGSVSANDSGGVSLTFSYPMFKDLEKASDVLAGVAGFRTFGANVTFRGKTSSSSGAFVSGQYFPLLGLKPARGRLFTPDDDRTPGGHPVVVLGYNYWNRQLGGSTDVLNEPMIINGNSMTILGVAPAEFPGNTFGHEQDFFVPISMRERLTPGWKGSDDRRNYWVYVFGRLQPGVTMAQAQLALNTVYSGLIRSVELPLQKGSSPSFRERFAKKQLTLEQGAQGFGEMRREGRPALSMLLGITGFVLLIACANIANLLLARAANRSREISIRLSVGASRWQLVRQLMSEAVLVALLGWLGGLMVARWTIAGVLTLIPHSAGAKVLSDRLDGNVLAFAFALAMLTGVLFGLFPSLHSTRPDLVSALKGQAGQVSASAAASRFRRALVTSQIALSLVLLICAGFFIKSLSNVARVDLGIRTDNLITFRLSPELSGYSFERSAAMFERLEQSLAAIPGVTASAGALVPVIAGNNWGSNVSVDGFQAGPDTDTHSMFNEVGPGYFSTMGIKLIAGREFTAADDLAAPKVAVINEAFAKKFHLKPDASSIGKRMRRGAGGKNDIEIVGIVRDTKYDDVKDAPPPLFFTPYRQDKEFGSCVYYVRTALDAGQMAPLIRRTVAEIDPQLPVENLKTMNQQVREQVFEDRVISILASSFAALATLLAAVGLYGVLAYSVTRRTREFGIRLALGADAGAMRNLVLREVGWMLLVGAGIAIPLTLWLGRFFESLLFGMKGNDAMVIAGATALLGAIALLSGYLPALRATRIDPLAALRHE